jgi:hypothetical protein
MPCLYQWLAGVNKAGGREINIDGKTILGSGRRSLAAHRVSAWVGNTTWCRDKLKTEEKSNEISAIPNG